MLEIEEYTELQKRPSGRCVMTQRWRSLWFLHASFDPQVIQALLPPELTVDTFPDESGAERAWLGLVLFRMEGVTLKGVPEIPGVHAFPETNVRTYVHHHGTKPGVWFFSLEAANSLACKIARRFFHLPYHEAKMSVLNDQDIVSYLSKRRSNGVKANGSVRVGVELLSPKPGSLEFFLAERYLLYSRSASQLFTGMVHHVPYSLYRAESISLDETLTEASGIPTPFYKHSMLSPGVNVEVFPLQAV